MPRKTTSTAAKLSERVPTGIDPTENGPEHDTLQEHIKQQLDRAITDALLPNDDLFAPMDEREDYINALWFGVEGTGKTTNLAMMANVCPADSKVLIINAESGAKRTALQRMGIDTSKIVLYPDPRKGLRITRDGLMQVYERIHTDLQHDPASWFGVGFDSATEINQVLRENVSDKRVAKTVNNVRAAGGDASLIDTEFVDLDDYNVMTDQFRRLLRLFRSLPCHFGVTALEGEDKQGRTAPAITPALLKDLMAFVDYALYCRATVRPVGEDDLDPGGVDMFRALCKPTPKTRAKDRFGVLPRVLADPTFARIKAYVDGTLTEEADPTQASFLERQQAEKEAAEQAKAINKTKSTRKVKARDNEGQSEGGVTA